MLSLVVIKVHETDMGLLAPPRAPLRQEIFTRDINGGQGWLALW